MPIVTPEIRRAFARERRRWWLRRLFGRWLTDLAIVLLGVFGTLGAGITFVVVRHPLALEAVAEAARSDVARLVGEGRR